MGLKNVCGLLSFIKVVCSQLLLSSQSVDIPIKYVLVVVQNTDILIGLVDKVLNGCHSLVGLVNISLVLRDFGLESSKSRSDVGQVLPGSLHSILSFTDSLL